jgi:hypothetical protein
VAPEVSSGHDEAEKSLEVDMAKKTVEEKKN